MVARGSCCERLVKFDEERVEVAAEKLAGSAEAAFLAKGYFGEVSCGNSEAGGDLFFDQVEVIELTIGETAVAVEVAKR